MKFTPLFAIAILFSSPAWAVNKCVGPDGKASFQDTPCAAGNGGKIDVRPASGQAAPEAQGAAQARVEKMKNDNEMAEAIRLQRPLVGMTIAQLNEAMGPATKVNADNYNGTQREQIIFERARETWYVYTRSGRVESIQNRPGAPVGSSAMRGSGAPCATQHEIRNSITSASSITLGETERAARWRAIQAMQDCESGKGR